MARSDIIVFDFETGSRNPHKTQPTQIAALALDGRNFRLKDTFNSEIKPILDDKEAIEKGLDPLEDKALEITRKTRDNLALAPDLKSVWQKFVQFVNKHNWNGNSFFAPIAAGFNIVNFDMIIINRLCRDLGPFDEKNNRQSLFNPIYKIDVMDNVFMWTEGDPNVKSISMDSLRERMGLSKDNAHDALQDVKDTANIMIKFMKTHRAVYRNLKLEKAFAGEQSLYVE
jgi:DNA polymerase III epsilon subunit-like protein